MPTTCQALALRTQKEVKDSPCPQALTVYWSPSLTNLAKEMGKCKEDWNTANCGLVLLNSFYPYFNLWLACWVGEEEEVYSEMKMT